MICAVYGEGAVTDQTCWKWFVSFCAGDFSLDDAPLSCRPVKVDSIHIETLTENNQCYTTWEIARVLKISKSIKLLVKIKNVTFILQRKWNRLLAVSFISWKKLNRLFCPTQYLIGSLRENICVSGPSLLNLEFCLTLLLEALIKKHVWREQHLMK